MTDFRQLSSSVWASPQITPSDVQEAAALGFVAVVNNRPEGEAHDQTTGAEIEAAARDAGLGYHAIPIGHAGFGDDQVSAMATILQQADGPVLAYCRSGTRSTFLWALARASLGDRPDELMRAANAAGYDLAPLNSALDSLHMQAISHS